MVPGGEFTITVSKKEVVAAVLPLQEHWLPLSNLDLLLPPVDVGVFFCYKKAIGGDTNFCSMVDVLMEALAQALVIYYAFAGEVIPNSIGEPELLCNNRGVDFYQAYADVELQNLNLYNPDESIQGKLVPKKKHGVFTVQATELKCGGLVVACTFDHRIADAYSANMFLVSWAEMARSKSPCLLPSFRRSLLSPRHPAVIHPSIDDMYVPISTLPPPPKESHHHEHDYLISRIYYVTADQINELQLMAGSKRTKLECFSAFLWKIIAVSAARSSTNNSCKAKTSKMGIVVNGRSRLKKEMENYFGNVLSIPFGEEKVNQLIEMPLSWVADQVHDFVENAVTEEHFLGLIDWVEAHRPEPALAKIYADMEEGPAFVVSSGQRFPVSKVNFGWGEPVFGSYHFPWGGRAGYVMPMPSPGKNGDWVVYMHLMKSQVELIETEATNVFRPLTFEYIINS